MEDKWKKIKIPVTNFIIIECEKINSTTVLKYSVGLSRIKNLLLLSYFNANEPLKTCHEYS